MKLSLYLGLVFLLSCQAPVRTREVDSAGLSNGAGITGTWLTTNQDSCSGLSASLNCSGKVRITIGETSFLYVVLDTNNLPINQTTKSRTIRFVSDESFYDYSLSEYVTYSLNGNNLRLCYDYGCENLTR